MNQESEFDKKSFLKLMNHLFQPLRSNISYAEAVKGKRDIISTDFLGRVKSTASRLEEMLDHYNAKNNIEWEPFRKNVSHIKLFTDVSYITLHLKQTSPKYKLLSGIDTFLSDTNNVIAQFSISLYWIVTELIECSKQLGLDQSIARNEILYSTITFPKGQLPSDLKKEPVDNPEKIIVSLATSYLNLASESVLLKRIKNLRCEDYRELVPDSISENSIRILESKFHNLQSLYDTYISSSDIEKLDSDLRLIRGHASIVYHLLEAATQIIHYYERHMMLHTDNNFHNSNSPISTEKILDILINYYINYAEQFLTAGKTLCKEVIAKYAEEGSIDVNVPVYRGFHVRPSTLVAKIIKHYGSEVFLHIGDAKYDASSPMNLFRVNEEINAVKRRNLAYNINNLKSIAAFKNRGDYQKGLKEIFHELLEENKIINYTTDFALPDIKSISEETLGEFANRAIANLLAQGKIDLRTDLMVTFVGDKRVLADLKILAACGYGEDCYGNNVVLPEELSYLRKA